MADALTALVNLAPGIVSLATKLAGESQTAKNNSQLIEFQSAIIQFQSLIATVQAENSSLIRQKTDLEKEIDRLKSWDLEKQRYTLVSPFSGAMVYALKREMSNGVTAHYLCTNCFNSGKPSILQITQDKDHWASFTCPICKSAARTGYRSASTPKYAEEIKGPE